MKIEVQRSNQQARRQRYLALVVAPATPRPHGLNSRGWPGLTPPPVLEQKHTFRQKRGELIQEPNKGAIKKRQRLTPALIVTRVTPRPYRLGDRSGKRKIQPIELKACVVNMRKGGVCLPSERACAGGCAVRLPYLVRTRVERPTM